MWLSDCFSDAFLRSLRKVLVSDLILRTGKSKPQAQARMPVSLSRLVTRRPCSSSSRKNSWNANSPFFLADHAMCFRGVNSSILTVALIGKKKGRKEHLMSFPSVRHLSAEPTLPITLFHSVQQERSVKVSQTFLAVERIITDSSISIQ